MTLPGFPEAMPLQGLIGGAMIGLAAAMLLLGSGRIAGVSGLFGRMLALNGNSAPRAMAALFVIGLMAGAVIVQAVSGGIVARFPSSPVLLAAAGLLVGFGTRLGSGCTSGHGVCGMSRFSKRSLIATATFMATGFVTVAIADLLGWGWS